MMSDTKSLNLEQCVNVEYAQVKPMKECEDCKGYNKTCLGYYPLKEQLGIVKIKNYKG